MSSFRDRYGFDDPLGDQFDEPHISGTESAAPVARRAKTKAEAQEARAAKRRSEASQQAASTMRRRRWEASPVGQARTRDIQDLVTERHNELARQYPDRLSPIERTGMSKAQIYHTLGVTFEGHGHGDQQLPGFENPHAAPEPPRWEDLTPEKRAATERNLRVRAGTDVGQMSRDFGAQLDQSIWRAHMAGHHDTVSGQPVPFTKHFYDEHPATAPEPLDRPKQAMRESRNYIQSHAEPGDPMLRTLREHPIIHTGVVSHVSPNTKFTAGPRGDRTSPNIEAAEAVFEQRAKGISSSRMTAGKNRRGITNQARPANTRRAGLMLEHIERGGRMGEARNMPSAAKPEGSSQWGPKTGPFVNSFDASHPDFLVSDVHTGGGGMVPHLGVKKPISNAPQHPTKNRPMTAREMLNAGMRIQREKSGRERAMESGVAVPGSGGKKVTFHAAADFAARQALAERGYGSSVRQAQATQWGEEQIQRKEAQHRLDLPTHTDAYPEPRRVLVNPNQMRLL